MAMCVCVFFLTRVGNGIHCFVYNILFRVSCLSTRYYVMNVIWASANRNLFFFSAC